MGRTLGTPRRCQGGGSCIEVLLLQNPAMLRPSPSSPQAFIPSKSLGSLSTVLLHLGPQPQHQTG